MRTGHYVSVVSGQKGFEKNVSGHIQVPLEAMRLLKQAGHDVHLITNRFGEDRSLPACMPDGVPVHLVDDARKRGGLLERTGGHTKGVKPLTAWRQLQQIKQICHENKLDILHLYGFTRTAELGGALRLTGLHAATVTTLFGPELRTGRGARVSKWLIKKNAAIVSATQHVASACESRGLSAIIVKHGIIRDIRAEMAQGDLTPGPRNRVLFWRDPSEANGADIVIKVYEALASKYPDILFTLAIRPHWSEIPGIDDLPSKHSNIQVHRFPYPETISLPKLMAESLLVLMPIREMSIDPQLVIAESLAAGVPVIATDQRSNKELIIPGKNGDLVPLNDAQAATNATDKLLADLPALQTMGPATAQDLQQRWNWDNYVKDIEAVYAQATT